MIYYIAMINEINDYVQDPQVKGWSHNQYLVEKYIEQSKNMYGSHMTMYQIEANSIQELLEIFIIEFELSETGVPFDLFEDTQILTLCSVTSNEIYCLTVNEARYIKSRLTEWSTPCMYSILINIKIIIILLLQFTSFDTRLEVLDAVGILSALSTMIAKGMADTDHRSQWIDPVQLIHYMLKNEDDTIEQVRLSLKHLI